MWFSDWVYRDYVFVLVYCLSVCLLQALLLSSYEFPQNALCIDNKMNASWLDC